jgi:lipid-A-disaccharide synthase
MFVCAGEASGDLIGSLLIKQLLKADPEMRIACNGGEQMAQAGAELRMDMLKDLAIVGLVEVISKLGKIRRVFKDTMAFLERERPRVVVLIDYPGFNLRLAKAAHDLGLKVVYYVVPQVWAWHKSRVHKIRKYVDRALVIEHP